MKEQQLKALPSFHRGEPVPNVELSDQDGKNVHLAEYWIAQPTVFCFIRHFGCPYCRRLLNQLNASYQKILDMGVQVIAIGMGDLEKTSEFHQKLRLRYPLLADEQEVAYAKYGLLMVEKPTLDWYLKVGRDLPVGLTMMAKQEYGPYIVGGNVYRMGGTFIVNTQGIAEFVHRDTDANNHVLLTEILATLRSMTGKP